MLLKKISLKNFRNFVDEKFSFNPFLTIIIGENSRGKTNILEAIHLVIHGEGFRETKEQELLQFEKNNAVVEAMFASGDDKFEFEIHLRKTDLTVNKIFTINKTKRKYFQYRQETPKTVLFSPEQIEIITGSPDGRRKYFNIQLSLYDYEYKKRILNYENALRKRNKILELHRNDVNLKEELSFWNNYLEEQGNYISKKRGEYVDFLNNNKKIDDKEFSMQYLKNEVSKSRFEEVFEIEKRYRKTLIGPQKDDFQIYLKKDKLNKNLHFFGSRSEQRLSVFWLKLNEIKYLEEKFKIKPILLLDDVFSELDLKNKKLVIDLIKKYQTVITTTEIELLELADVPKSVIKL